MNRSNSLGEVCCSCCLGAGGVLVVAAVSPVDYSQEFEVVCSREKTDKYNSSPQLLLRIGSVRVVLQIFAGLSIIEWKKSRQS